MFVAVGRVGGFRMYGIEFFIEKKFESRIGIVGGGRERVGGCGGDVPVRMPLSHSLAIDDLQCQTVFSRAERGKRVLGIFAKQIGGGFFRCAGVLPTTPNTVNSLQWCTTVGD